jgi:hypothetical protein
VIGGGPSVVRAARMNLPVSGGGYFRLYPYWVTRRALSQINRHERRPFVFYVHPWEIDHQQPRLSAGSWLARRRHYVNLASTERKLCRLLSSFRFGPLREVIALQADNRDEQRVCAASHS